MHIEPDEQICEIEPMYDLAEIRRGIQLLCAPTRVYELRALAVARAGTVSGYYDGEHRADLANAFADLSGYADGVYITLNPAMPDALARSVNRSQPYAKHTTGDAEIVERCWLPLDFDPVRLSGISSTDAEHEAALAKARECREFLLSLGFSNGSLVLIDSGNGAHVLCRIQLPNDAVACSLVKTCIDAVAERFSDAAVKVDQTTYNAARIWKVPGTMACKGDHTDRRPHRIARVITRPKHITSASAQVLKKLAALAPPAQAVVRRPEWQDKNWPFDLERWFDTHNVPVEAPKSWQGGRLWTLRACPWNPQHNKGEAYVVQHASGAISARCHHDSCQGKGWSDLRALYEGSSKAPAITPQPAWLATASPIVRKSFEDAVLARNNN